MKGGTLREGIIERRMTDLFGNTLACKLAVLSRREWRTLDTEPRFRFGYMPPTGPATGAPMLVSFAPALIDAVTASLSDDEFDIYLTAVETLVAAFFMRPGRTPDEVLRWVEDELMRQAPSALELMTNIEMNALDNGTVSSCTF